MSNYWARFEEINGNIYRYDTRIYIQAVSKIEKDDICIGAIVGKNPGSAKGNVGLELKEINLDGDKLLPTVRNIFLKSIKLAKIDLPERAYIQVLNLFYLCEPDLDLAINEAREKTIKGICETENKRFPFVWFVWGGDNIFLNSYKERFRTIKTTNHFYYNYIEKEIVNDIPTDFSPVKHTQGLTHDFVIPHIVKILENNY